MISFRDLKEINRHGIKKNATKAELKAIRSNPRSSKGAKQLAHWKLNMHHNEGLDDWFNKEKWVRMDTKGNIKGDCAREPGEGKPKCLPKAKAQAMSKEDRGKAARRKRREDPQVDRPGTGNKPINVKTEEKMVSHEYSSRMKKHGKMSDDQKAAVKAVYDKEPVDKKMHKDPHVKRAMHYMRTEELNAVFENAGMVGLKEA